MANGLCEVLVVEVAGQRLGLPGAMVRELLRAVFITPWPRGPRFVEGVINIRGHIVPVLDLRHWLDLPAKPVEPSDHFVVVLTKDGPAVLRVDRALDLIRLPGANVEPAGLRGAAITAGVAKFPDGLVLLPDLEPLLGQAHLVPAPGAAEGMPS